MNASTSIAPFHRVRSSRFFILTGLALSISGASLPAIASPVLIRNSALLVAQSTPAQPSPVLRRGDRGDAVSQLQRRLLELDYYSGEVTGVFGSQTEAAVIRFQEANGLRGDGLVGTATQAALRRGGPATTTTSNASAGNRSTPSSSTSSWTGLRYGERGDRVTSLQNRLAELGYFSGPISGVYGDGTRNAVTQFQRDQELIPNGAIDADTQAALQKATVNPARTVTTTTRTGPSSGTPTPPRPATEAAPLPSEDTAVPISRGDRPPVPGEGPSAIAQSAPNSFPRVETAEFGTQPNLPTIPPSDLETLPPPQVPSVPPLGVGVPPASRQSQLAATAARSSSEGILLRPGDRGRDVGRVQSRLRDLRFYRGGITEVYDRQTELAVAEFQRSRGLRVDGIVGPQTASALGLSSGNFANNPNPDIPLRGDQYRGDPYRGDQYRGDQYRGDQYSVMELQRRLQSRGFYRGPIDGILGPQTRAAIRAAQREYRISEGDVLQGQF